MTDEPSERKEKTIESLIGGEEITSRYCGTHGYEGAIDNYCKALTLDPKCTSALYNLGNAFCGLSDYYFAINKIRMVPVWGYFISPDYCYYPEALLSYDALLEIDPEHLPALERRNAVIKALGKASVVPLKLRAFNRPKEDRVTTQFITKVEVANFSDCLLTLEQVHNLVQILTLNSTLITIRLDRSQLTDRGLAALAGALAKNSTITTLTFSGNSLLTSASDPFKKQIQAYLYRNRLFSLEKITAADLKNVDLMVLRPADLYYILTRHSDFTQLDFSGKSLVADAILFQPESWPVYSALIYLNLQNNQLADEGIKRLAGLLKIEPCLFPFLSVLDLSHNQIHDKGFKELAVVLLKIKTLTACILDRNYLSYRGFQDFLRIIRVHPRLERLSLRENRICEVDKEELDRNIGILLRGQEEHALQHVDVTGNYFTSKSHDPNRLAILRLLLRATGLSVEEFACAEWVREKNSQRAHHTILRLAVDGEERDFEVPLTVMDAFNAYRTAQNLGSDSRVIQDLQNGLTHNLRRHPELKPVRLSTMDAKTVKEQKQLCKQMLFYHPKAPLKAYLQSHPELRTEKLSQATCLLCPNQSITPQEWCVYFLADCRQEHALLAWEGLYSYGQRVLKVAHLTFKEIKTPGLWGRIIPTKQLVIGYHLKADVAAIESFRDDYEFAVFRAPKEAVKTMEATVDHDLGNMPGKYKAILSSGSGSSELSPEDQQKVVTNCQKWALEKLEECLSLPSQTLQAYMSPLPSRTVKVLQALPQARVAEESVPLEVKAVEEKSSCSMM